jgi:hypothetical protein
MGFVFETHLFFAGALREAMGFEDETHPTLADPRHLPVMPANAGIHDFCAKECVWRVLVVDAGLRRHDEADRSKPASLGISHDKVKPERH